MPSLAAAEGEAKPAGLRAAFAAPPGGVRRRASAARRPASKKSLDLDRGGGGQTASDAARTQRGPRSE